MYLNLHFLFSFFQPKGRQFVYFRKTELDFNPLYMTDFSIAIAADYLSFNVTLNFAQDLIRDPWCKVSLAIRNRKYDTFRNVFQYDVNACHILDKTNSQLNNLIFSWINNIWANGDLPQSCPIKKVGQIINCNQNSIKLKFILQANYSFINMNPEKWFIPNLPLGHYRIVANSYFRQDFKKDFISNCTMYIDIK